MGANNMQKVYKANTGYYAIQKEALQKEGYIIVEDTDLYTVFEKPHDG
jgi:hypothetical protein